MKLDSQLPYVIQLAAGATQLDNIKIERVKHAIPTQKTFFFLKVGNWEKRMTDRCVAQVNEAIRSGLIRYKDPKFYITERGLMITRQNPIFAMVDLHYNIK